MPVFFVFKVYFSQIGKYLHSLLEQLSEEFSSREENHIGEQVLQLCHKVNQHNFRLKCDYKFRLLVLIADQIRESLQEMHRA